MKMYNHTIHRQTTCSILFRGDFESYPPCSRYVGNSSLTERILSWLVDESRDALKTKMDFLRQWEFQPDPSLSGYV